MQNEVQRVLSSRFPSWSAVNRHTHFLHTAQQHVAQHTRINISENVLVTDFVNTMQNNLKSITDFLEASCYYARIPYINEYATWNIRGLGEKEEELDKILNENNIKLSVNYRKQKEITRNERD